MSPTLRRWLPAASLIGLPSLITLVLYWPVLTLPYFWDDFPHYNFATSKSWWGLWTNATGLPYYRPLTTTINKLFFDNLPFGATLLPHLLAVLGHVLACILAGYVAGVMFEGPGRPAAERQPWRRAAVATTAAVLFAAFPFATLTVACYSCATHVWLVDLSLAGLAALLHFARGGGRVFALLAIAAALLAPTAHEAGVMAGPIMAVSLGIYDRAFARRHLWLLVALAAASALFLPVWLLVPKSRDASTASLAVGDGSEILAKLSFFLQAPSYPFQPLAALLISRLKAWDLGAIWLSGLPPLAGAGAWQWRRGRGRVLAFAAAWTALAMLPSVVALHFDYIVTSQRLLYFPGPAAAVLWGAVLVELAAAGRGRAQRLTAVAATGLLAGAALGIPTAYAVREARLNVLALSPLQQLDAAARRYPRDRHLIINTVNWMSYRQIWYPLGHDGLAVLAPYLNLTDLVYINTGVRLDATVATFPDLLPAFHDHYISTANEGPDQLWNTAIFSAHIAGVDHAWLTTYTDSQATLEEVGHVSASAVQPPAQFLGRFENSVYLLDGHFSVDGSGLHSVLDWRYLGPDPNATIFRNAFDCAGHVAGLASGQALGTMLPFGALAAGTELHDLRTIPLDARAADNCYQMQVGLFRSDGSRVPVFGMDGQPLVNQLVLIKR